MPYGISLSAIIGGGLRAIFGNNKPPTSVNRDKAIRDNWETIHAISKEGNMDYLTWKEFIDEWGEPDSSNFAISISAPDKDIDLPWSLEIAQPRKDRIQTVFINSASKKQIQDWANKSLKIIKEGLIQ